jgi:hypothetical protein
LIQAVIQGLAAQNTAHAAAGLLAQNLAKGTPSQVIWNAGEPAKRLIRVTDGICFLSGVGGSFQGGGEEVGVVTHDGWYFLEGRSGQQALRATATVIKFAR